MVTSEEKTGLIREERTRFKAHCTSDNLPKAVGYTAFLSSMILSTIASACAQALGRYVPGNQRNCWRYLGQFMSILPIVAVKKVDVRITCKRHLVYLTIVCLICPAFFWFYYGADASIPTSSVGCLHITALIVGSIVVSVFVLREFEWYMSAAVVLCIIGVTLVTQPQFIFHSREQPIVHPLCGLDDQAENQTLGGHTGNDSNSNHDGFSLNITSNMSNIMITRTGKIPNVKVGYLYVVLSGLLYAVFMFCVNKGLKVMDSFVIIFWLAVSGLILSIVGMFIFETPMLPSNRVCLGLLMTHGATSGSCMVLVVWGISLLPPRVCAILTTFEVVLMSIAQYSVLKDINKGHGNVVEVIGVLIVLLGNMVRPVCHIIAEVGRNKDAAEELLENKELSR